MNNYYCLDTMTFIVRNLERHHVAKLKENAFKTGSQALGQPTSLHYDPRKKVDTKTKEEFYRLRPSFGEHDWFTVNMKTRYNTPISLFYNEGTGILRFSFSVPKYYFGVNFIPYDNPLEILQYFYCDLCHQFDLKDFPSLEKWEITRADIAIQFQFPTQEHVEDFFFYLGALEWASKEVHIYPKTSINFSGSTVSGRIYNKFEESRESLKKIQNALKKTKWHEKPEEFMEALLEKTKGVVRFELEFIERLRNLYKSDIRLKGFISMKGDQKTVNVEEFFSGEYFTLESLFTDEMESFLGDHTKTFVTEYVQVIQIIAQHFKNSKNSINKISNAIFSFITISLCGKRFLERLTNKTFANDHRKLLRELGVSTSKATLKNFNNSTLTSDFSLEELHRSKYVLKCKPNADIIEELTTLEKKYNIDKPLQAELFEMLSSSLKEKSNTDQLPF